MTTPPRASIWRRAARRRWSAAGSRRRAAPASPVACARSCSSRRRRTKGPLARLAPHISRLTSRVRGRGCCAWVHLARLMSLVGADPPIPRVAGQRRTRARAAGGSRVGCGTDVHSGASIVVDWRVSLHASVSLCSARAVRKHPRRKKAARRSGGGLYTSYTSEPRQVRRGQSQCALQAPELALLLLLGARVPPAASGNQKNVVLWQENKEASLSSTDLQPARPH